jgi:hypothetical protein
MGRNFYTLWLVCIKKQQKLGLNLVPHLAKQLGFFKILFALYKPFTLVGKRTAFPTDSSFGKTHQVEDIFKDKLFSKNFVSVS